MSYTLVLNTPSRLAFEYAILISSLWATFWQLLHFARIGYVSFTTKDLYQEVICAVKMMFDGRKAIITNNDNNRRVLQTPNNMVQQNLNSHLSCKQSVHFHLVLSYCILYIYEISPQSNLISYVVKIFFHVVRLEK